MKVTRYGPDGTTVLSSVDVPDPELPTPNPLCIVNPDTGDCYLLTATLSDGGLVRTVLTPMEDQP